MRRRKICFLVVIVLMALCAMWYSVRPSAEGYAVHGVDVSHYQGEIDFNRLAAQGMRFAFIKATEGSTYIDERLEENIAGVRQADMRAGFYHFFSYDSPGIAQAENFIANVPVLDGMLPPVIDVEFYGDYFRNPADPERAIPELREMADVLDAHYGVKPIIYCTQKAYLMYVRKAFDDCDLWIRSVWWKPLLDRKWTFWQYTDRAELQGYSGVEPHIDVNVFCGSEEEFRQYPW